MEDFVQVFAEWVTIAKPLCRSEVVSLGEVANVVHRFCDVLDLYDDFLLGSMPVLV